MCFGLLGRVHCAHRGAYLSTASSTLCFGKKSDLQREFAGRQGPREVDSRLQGLRLSDRNRSVKARPPIFGPIAPPTIYRSGRLRARMVRGLNSARSEMTLPRPARAVLADAWQWKR